MPYSGDALEVLPDIDNDILVQVDFAFHVHCDVMLMMTSQAKDRLVGVEGRSGAESLFGL